MNTLMTEAEKKILVSLSSGLSHESTYQLIMKTELKFVSGQD